MDNRSVQLPVNHVQSCSTQLSSGKLSYVQWGTGMPILCLHGLGDLSWVWQSLGVELSNTYCCIALDLPGHGDSFKPKSTQDYLSSNFVSVLEEFANANQWSQIQVVAHSWAAKLVLLWAKMHPSRIQRLILVDPFFVNRFPPLLKPTLPILYRVLPFLKMIGPFASHEAAKRTAKQLKQYQGWSDFQQLVFEKNMEEKSNGVWGSKFTISARNGVFLDTFVQSGLTETLSTPTHILLPEQGLNCRDWQLKPYRQYLSQHQFHNLPGNHWPHLVKPKSFNAVVATILNDSNT